MAEPSKPLSTPSPSSLAEKHEQQLATTREEIAVGCREGRNMINTDALKSISGEMLGCDCREVFWIASGGFHFIFLLVMADETEVIARVCRPDSDGTGRPWSDAEVLDVMESEVATLQYLRENTSIPVPKVLGYKAHRNSTVGSAFMLQERIYGQQATSDIGDFAAHSRFIRQVARYQAELLRQRFSARGILRRNLNTGEIKVTPRNLTLGPPHQLIVNDVVVWLKALCLRQLDFLESEDFEREWRKFNPDSGIHPPRSELFRWYRAVHKVLDALPYLRSLADAPYVLMHVDFTFGNILVAYDDPSRVVGIVDWDYASVEPIWFASAWPAVLHCEANAYGLAPWQRGALTALRDKIVRDAVPGVREILEHGEAVRLLHSLLSNRYFLTGPTQSFPFEAARRMLMDLWPDPDLEMLLNQSMEES